MAKYALFHLIKPVEHRHEGDESPFRKAFFTGDVGDALHKGLFSLVLIAEQPGLDALYNVTNSCGGRWHTRIEGQLFQERPRSTSVGDIVIEVETGDAYCVRMTGWESLDDTLPGLDALRESAGAAQSQPVQPSSEETPQLGCF